MRFGRAWGVIIAGVWVLSAGREALGLVNPSLQPSHLMDRYLAVVSAEVTAIDEASRRITLQVREVGKGEFAPKEIVITVPQPSPAEAETDDMAEEPASDLYEEAAEGNLIVAYVGKPRKRHEGEALLYDGKQWHEAIAPDAADMSKLTWTKALGDEMYGTFNGSPDRLLDLVKDLRDGTAFFPPFPYVKFKDDLLLAKLEQPARGVAMFDADGDGRLDAYACSEGGDRLFIQAGPMKFEDRTVEMGLENVASPSVSFADVDGDGLPDLLAGGVIYLRGPKGFWRSSLLPAQAAENLKCSSFVDVNADGYPDVIVSRKNGGLAMFVNGGVKGGAFADATAQAQLDRKECGAGGNGFFAFGDFNGDGRVDLYYAVGQGMILTQDAQGRFSPLPHGLPVDFKATSAHPSGMTGAGCFAAVWADGSQDLAFATDTSVFLVVNQGGKVVNATGWGNEITECSGRQLATLAEDLNMDGNVDLLTVSWETGYKSSFHSNRGYGSFMLDHKYEKYEAFPGNGYNNGGVWGLAAGDVNGDGANDLLLGRVDGTVVLMVSDVLSNRKADVSSLDYEQKLAQTRILTVHVRGNLGVLGADVRLADKAGKTVGRRVIGSQVLTGCRGPDAVNLAVRQPGSYVLTVRYSDGVEVSKPVDLTGEKHAVVDVARPAKAQTTVGDKTRD